MDCSSLVEQLVVYKEGLTPYSSNGRLAFQVKEEFKAPLREFFDSQEESRQLSRDEYRDTFGGIIQYGLVTSWIAENLYQEDPETIANKLCRYFEWENISGRNLLIISGLSIKLDDGYDGENFSLIPLEKLSNSAMKSMILDEEKQTRMDRRGSYSVLLSKMYQVPRLAKKGLTLEYPFQDLFDTAAILSLLGPCGVSPLSYWWQPDENYPTFMVNRCQRFLDDSVSAAHLPIEDTSRLEEIAGLVSKFSELDNSEKAKIRIALKYFNQSMCKIDQASKAIDLAIALESLLLDDRDKTEFSFTFRLRGAKLLSGSEWGSRTVYDNLKQLYTYRSQAVHSGILKGGAVIRTNLKNSIGICAEIIQKRIGEGRPDWDELVLN